MLIYLRRCWVVFLHRGRLPGREVGNLLASVFLVISSNMYSYFLLSKPSMETSMKKKQSYRHISFYMSVAFSACFPLSSILTNFFLITSRCTLYICGSSEFKITVPLLPFFLFLRQVKRRTYFQGMKYIRNYVPIKKNEVGT
jgi:hypothetical protein